MTLSIKFFWPLLMLAIVVSNSCVAQRTVLMLQKKNKHKNAYYKSGDEIAFRKVGSKQKITGEIIGFSDSVIVFRGFEVRVNHITSLYIDDKTKWWLRYKIEQLCLLAGGAYLLADVINHGELSEDTLIISGTLIVVGVVARILIGNRIKIRGNTKLRILRL